MLQALTGHTLRLTFNFFDDLGNRSPVDDPRVDIFTPQRTKQVVGGSLTSGNTTGRYFFDFFVGVGLTPGHWFGLGSGETDSGLVFHQKPFEILDTLEEPFWIGLDEFRDHLGLAADDHARDVFHNGILQASMSLIEARTRRQFSLKGFSEVVEIKNTDRVRLKHYPIQAITALTATVRISPFSQTQLFTEVLSTSSVNFNFRADLPNGILFLTDTSGFDLTYDGVLLAVTYNAGFATIPEGVRRAALMLASKLANLASSEGIDTLRLGDLSFAISRNLFEGVISDALDDYKIVEF